MTDQDLLSFDRFDDVTVATMSSAEITPGIADTLMATVSGRGEDRPMPPLVLDLSKIRFINSVALGWLVELRRRLKEDNRRLALVGITGHCLNVLEVTGLERIFDLYDDVGAAVADLTPSSVEAR